jgi:hypothetical protein
VLVAKQFELLHEMVPNSAVIGVLVNPTSPSLTESTARDAQAAGRSMGKQIHILNAGTEDQIDAAFASLTRVRPDALLIGGDAFFLSRRAGELGTVERKGGLLGIWGTHAPDWAAPAEPTNRGGTFAATSAHIPHWEAEATAFRSCW